MIRVASTALFIAAGRCSSTAPGAQAQQRYLHASVRRRQAAMAGAQVGRNGKPMSTVVWLGWLCVAVAAHFMIAMFGVLSRYLMVKAQPPVPSLRLLLLISLLGSASMVLCYTIPMLIFGLVKKRRRQPEQQGQQLAAGQGTKASPAGEADSKPTADLESTAGSPDEAQGEGPEGASQLRVRVQQPKSSVRPDVPLAKGLSARFERLQSRRPLLIRRLALLALTLCGLAAGALQLAALNFIDASIVQLVNMFTVIFIALFQALLLRHRIPVMLWPTAGLMVAGAAMVIGPTVGKSAVGGLGSPKSWLGLAMSVGYMLCMVTYFILLQATRHMGFSSAHIQYYFMFASIVLLVPISLPVDGVDWAADMAPWNATDWVVLGVLGTVVCLGAGVLIQHATWHLGAPTVSLFYGLRLVFTVVQSKLILSATIIQKPLQICGILLTALSVTAYMVWQWWHVKRAAAAAKKKAAAGEPGPEEEGSPSSKKLDQDIEDGGGAGHGELELSEGRKEKGAEGEEEDNEEEEEVRPEDIGATAVGTTLAPYGLLDGSDAADNATK